MKNNYDYLFEKKKEYIKTSEFFLFLLHNEKDENDRKETLELYIGEIRKLQEIDRKLEKIRDKYKKYRNRRD